MRHTSTISSIAGFVAAWICLGSPDALAADKAEYYRRLAAADPRSAPAFVELASWCSTAGLETEARACYARAIDIDPDCESARQALGYKRQGTEWRKEGETPAGYPRPQARGLKAPVSPGSGAARRVKSAPAPAPPAGDAEAAPPQAQTVEAPAAPPEPEASSPPAAPPEPPAVAEGPPPAPPAAPGTPPPDPDAPTSTAEAEAIPTEIARKKDWARSAGERIATTFNTHEDADFLIHTTLAVSSREMKLLLKTLRDARKALGTLAGAAGTTKVWPDKLQVFLLKSEPEYERFASLVDRLPSAKNPDGLYSHQGHTVVLQPDSSALWRVVGETALARLHGTDRWVPWWLEDGVAEILYAQSPQGQKDQHYQRTIQLAADVMQADGDALKVDNLLQTATYKDKDTSKNRALALSLVDFLFKKSRSGLSAFVKALKSEAAPVPPPADAKDKDAFDNFFLGFIGFQETALESSFRMKAAVIGERWKIFTVQTAENLKAQDTAKDKDDAQKAQKKNKKKGN